MRLFRYIQFQHKKFSFDRAVHYSACFAEADGFIPISEGDVKSCTCLLLQSNNTIFDEVNW